MRHETFQEDGHALVQIGAVVIRWLIDQIDKLLFVESAGLLYDGMVKEIECIGADIGADAVEPVVEDAIAQRGPDHQQAEWVDGAVAEDGVVKVGEDILGGGLNRLHGLVRIWLKSMVVSYNNHKKANIPINLGTL